MNTLLNHQVDTLNEPIEHFYSNAILFQKKHNLTTDVK